MASSKERFNNHRTIACHLGCVTKAQAQRVLVHSSPSSENYLSKGKLEGLWVEATGDLDKIGIMKLLETFRNRVASGITGPRITPQRLA